VGNRIPSAWLPAAGFLFTAQDKNKMLNSELPDRTKATVMNCCLKNLFLPPTLRQTVCYAPFFFSF